MIENFLNPKGHHNPIIGSKVTAILLKGWILPIGGASSGRVCVCSLRSRIILTEQYSTSGCHSLIKKSPHKSSLFRHESITKVPGGCHYWWVVRVNFKPLELGTCNFETIYCNVQPHHVSNVMCHLSHVRCHMSGVRCHMSGVTCQVSHVRWNMSRIFLFFLDQVDGVSWCRVCCQRGLPRLVFPKFSHISMKV